MQRYFEASEQAGWFSNSGPCHDLLVERLRARVGTWCTPVASGTAGLAVALQALRREGRRKVVIPSFTFAAVPGAVSWCGLESIFIDIEPTGWHADPVSLAEALDAHGKDVAAVIVGSSFGIPPDPEQSSSWTEICQLHEVPLIVDSAAGFGSVRSDGQPLGSQGDAEVFSFHATKPFAIGEGGLITTGDPTLHEEIRRLINFGFNKLRIVDRPPGINAKLSEVQAATGLAMLDMLDEVLATRRALAAEYTEAFSAARWIVQANSRDASWQFFSVVAPSTDERNAARERCARRGVETQSYYYPLHLQPAFSQCLRVGSLAVTEEVASRILSLPIFNAMTPPEVNLVAAITIG